MTNAWRETLMAVRWLLTDTAWAEIEPRLAAIKHKAGSPPELSDRLFIEAVLYVARTGIPWEDLPERFGNANSQWRRFDRWAKKGRWDPILAALRDPDLDVLILDSTAVRAHPCAAGAKKNGTAPAASPSRPSAAAGAGSAPRFTPPATVSVTRSSWS
jgi:transposase